jgi:hypothetical protein
MSYDEEARKELYHIREAIRFLARKIDQINDTYAKPDNTVDAVENLLKHD